jgi:hypothetical protein
VLIGSHPTSVRHTQLKLGVNEIATGITPNFSWVATNAVGGSFIHGLQTGRPRSIPNPTNAVGGSFIHGLQTKLPVLDPESHQRSWWIVHTRPAIVLLSFNVQLSYARAMQLEPFKEIMNNPPTALVGFRRLRNS